MYFKFPLYSLFILILVVSCAEEEPVAEEKLVLRFEKINQFLPGSELPFKYRLTYYSEDGVPQRWLELDSLGRMTTDYIYEYDENGIQTGARYREDGSPEFSPERVLFENDSTKVTEWLDSTGQVYYRMIDNLDDAGKTYRAAFIGDKLHGYDSTFYTPQGFEKRIFFTNTKGKIFNDRRFEYDSVNPFGDWVTRRKIMADTVREIHKRELVYQDKWGSRGGMYYEGIISTAEFDENVVSFSRDGAVLFLTRTTDWNPQAGYIAYRKNGLFKEARPIPELRTIYNGAISPGGDKILYSIRSDEAELIYLTKKDEDSWGDPINISANSALEGGYFNWAGDSEVYFYTNANEGDIVAGELGDNKLEIVDSLSVLNTVAGTEFSPFVDPAKRFLIFTRYREGDPANQGFFVSNNLGDASSPEWSTPEKIHSLPYGWGAFIIENGQLFLYTDGEDIYGIPVDSLGLTKIQG